MMTFQYHILLNNNNQFYQFFVSDQLLLLFFNLFIIIVLLLYIMIINNYYSLSTHTHTHTQRNGETWRGTHRVMHTKIERGGGKRKEGEDDYQIMYMYIALLISTVGIGLCGCSFLCLSINVFI